jgi:hypothetical protein
MKKITADHYFNELTHQFPATKNEIDGLQDWWHMKMEVFSRYTITNTKTQPEGVYAVFSISRKHD